MEIAKFEILLTVVEGGPTEVDPRGAPFRREEELLGGGGEGWIRGGRDRLHQG